MLLPAGVHVLLPELQLLMDAAEITALCTGIPAILGAVTALIVALKAHGKATAAEAAVAAHRGEA